MRETAEAPGQRDNEDTKFAVQVQRMSGRASISGKRWRRPLETGPARSTIIAWPDENEPHRQVKDSFERPLN